MRGGKFLNLCCFLLLLILNKKISFPRICRQAVAELANRVTGLEYQVGRRMTIDHDDILAGCDHGSDRDDHKSDEESDADKSDIGSENDADGSDNESDFDADESDFDGRYIFRRMC